MYIKYKKDWGQIMSKQLSKTNPNYYKKAIEALLEEAKANDLFIGYGIVRGVDIKSASMTIIADSGKMATIEFYKNNQ